tara:strand:+ start:139 stop:318 length:180 start_codon:yes stop_codon:yes gene_type:complete
MKKLEVTKREFEKYLGVQESGVTNMFDVKTVQWMSDLSKEKILYIMTNYNKIKNIYEVR